MSRDDDYQPLSPAGAARRQAILADALHAADARRRNRVVVRASAVTACVALAIATVFASLAHRTPDAPLVHETPHPAPTTSPAHPQPSPTPNTPLVVIEIIRPGDIRPKWEVLTDDQLLAALADAGRLSGVVQLNGRSVLVELKDVKSP